MGKLEVEDNKARKILSSVQARIKAMSGVHELLMDKDPESDIAAPAYFRELIGKISANISTKKQDIEVLVTTSDFDLDARTVLT